MKTKLKDLKWRVVPMFLVLSLCVGLLLPPMPLGIAQDNSTGSPSDTIVVPTPPAEAGPPDVVDCNGNLIVHKVDAANPALALAGAVFQFFKWNGSQWVSKGTGTTNAAGTFSFNWGANGFGKYKVTEITPPFGYLLSNPASQEINLPDASYDGDHPLYFQNPQIVGSIRVRKIDQDGHPVSGFTFHLYRKGSGGSWNLLGDFPPTGADGWTQWDNLPAGAPPGDAPHYKIVEDAASYPFAYEFLNVTLDGSNAPNPPTGFIRPPDPMVVVFQNRLTILGSVSVTKKDDSGALLDGAQFTLTGPSYPTGDSQTTAAGNNPLVWSALLPGEYTLAETIVPAGHNADPAFPKTFTIPTSGDYNFSYEATNSLKKGSVSLSKTFVGTPTTVTFTLSKIGGGYSNSQTLSGNGVLSWTNLALGDYLLTEEAPAGYTKSSDIPNPITVDETHLVLSYNATNTQLKGSINVSKTFVGATTTVTFTLSKVGGGYSHAQTLSHNGSLTWSDLEWGTYTLIEQAPAGYILTTDIPSSIVIDGAILDFYFYATNTQTLGEVRIDKSGNNGEALAGAGFALFVDDNGNGIHDSGELLVQDSGVTDANGHLAFTQIPYGHYVLVESQIPAGYQAVPNQAVVISGQGQIVSFALDDPPNPGSIEVTKRDADTSALLAGATFRLEMQNGSWTQVGADQTTNSNGLVIWTNLEWGTYRVREIAAPAGYGLADPQVGVLNGSTPNLKLSFTFRDTPLTGSVQVIKRDAITGALLSGASFRLDQWNGMQWVQVGITQSAGIATWSGLPWGHYQVTELTPPPSYGLPTVVTQQGTLAAETPNLTLTFTFNDPPLVGSVVVSKTDTAGNPLSGATFLLEKLVGGVWAEIGTQNGGRAVWSGLTFTTYRVTELTPPAGYGLPAVVTQQGTLDANSPNLTLAFIFADPQLTGTLQVTKTDTAGNVIAGATFKVERLEGGSWSLSGGFASLTGLPFGTYQVTELTPPVGYGLPAVVTQQGTLDANSPNLTLAFIFADPKTTEVQGETASPPPPPPSTPPPTPPTEVLGQTAAPPSSLPVTGSPISFLVVIGGLTLLAGIFLFISLGRSGRKQT